jgi:hypothetical protein
MRTTTLFDSQLLNVKKEFTDRYYLMANFRQKGKILSDEFNVRANLIGMLEDNQVSPFLTVNESNIILDNLVWV